MDAKLRELDAKMAELREVTRAANETLGDLRRERREMQKWIDTTFEERMMDHFRRLHKEVGEFLESFSQAIRIHCDGIQKAIANRWKHIEMMCLTDPEMARMIAVHVLQGDGEPVETNNTKWHLVKETFNNGRVAFGFHSSLERRADADPTIESAIQRAVDEYAAPDFELFTSFLDTEGLDKK